MMKRKAVAGLTDDLDDLYQRKSARLPTMDTKTRFYNDQYDQQSSHESLLGIL